MNAPRQIELFGVTDVGCVRSGNEDCFTLFELGKTSGELNPQGRLHVTGTNDVFLAVSDGMGGAAAGEVASSTALITLSQYLDDHGADLAEADPRQLVAVLEEGVHTANRAIFQKSQEVANRRGMGATITAAFLKNDILYLFQIGDSRAYVIRDGQMIRITRDQSFVGHLVEMGTITEEQAMRHPQRNVILQALGTQEKLKVDVSFLPLCKGDIVLMCSDGLYGEFAPGSLEKLVGDIDRDDIQPFVQRLLDDAKTAGGKDNITIVAMRVNDGMPDRAPGEHPRYRAFSDLSRDNPVDRSSFLN